MRMAPDLSPFKTLPRQCRSSASASQQKNRVRIPVVYAIVRSGGTQQKVAVGDVIDIDLVKTAEGESLSLPAVLYVDGDTVTADADSLAKVSVTAEVVGATKGPKIIIQKYKNKTGYKKRQGHRQKYTQVKITEIAK